MKTTINWRETIINIYIARYIVHAGLHPAVRGLLLRRVRGGAARTARAGQAFLREGCPAAAAHRVFGAWE